MKRTYEIALFEAIKGQNLKIAGVYLAVLLLILFAPVMVFNYWALQL